MRLPIDMRAAIERLLHEGDLSHRQIAQRLDVPRRTVDWIDHRRDDSGFLPLVRPLRCPVCGAAITLSPCVTCVTEGRLPDPRPRLEAAK